MPATTKTIIIPPGHEYFYDTLIFCCEEGRGLLQQSNPGEMIEDRIPKPLCRCDENCTNCAIETQSSATLCRDALNCLYLAPGKCMSCIGETANMTLVGFLAHPGPPSPDMNHCVPCSFSALNNYYGDSICSTGLSRCHIEPPTLTTKGIQSVAQV